VLGGRKEKGLGREIKAKEDACDISLNLSPQI